MLIALSVIWALFYGVRIHRFYNSSEAQRSTFDATAGNSSGSGMTTDSTCGGGTMPAQKPKMRDRSSSSAMPTYIDKLYDQQGIKGSRTSVMNDNEHSVVAPSVVKMTSIPLPTIKDSPRRPAVKEAAPSISPPLDSQYSANSYSSSAANDQNGANE